MEQQQASLIQHRLLTNFLCLPDCLISLSRIDQAGKGCLISMSRIFDPDQKN